MVDIAWSNVSPTAIRPHVLVVDDEAEIVELISDVLTRQASCRMFSARSLAEARLVLETQAVDILVADVHLPDGDGVTLLPLLQRHHPHANAIVITGSPSIEGAITSLRQGAVDFLLKPFSMDELTDRVAQIFKRQAQTARHEQRIGKLRHTVRQINTARKVVTRKVDLLCHDLIGAYGELSRQLYQVRTQEGFKNFVDGANGLEQLLCRAMDYLMRQCGHCNMAMWLAGKERRFQLGAYMKYRIPGQKALIDAMEQGVVRLADREGFIRVSEDGSKELLTDEEMDYLSDQDVMAINCTYLGETLAVLVMFRDAAKGFTDADAAVLKAISPLLAISLAAVVRRPREESGNGGNTTREEAEDQASADADWWKKGEPPPF